MATLSLNEESQRLEECFLLLGKLSQCLWHSSSVSELLNGFCHTLVSKAGYLSAAITLTLDQQQHQASDSKALQNATQHLHSLTLDIHHLNQEPVIGQLCVVAEFDLSRDSAGYQLLKRLVTELNHAISLWTKSSISHAEHHSQEQLSRQELLALTIGQSPFAIVITNHRGELEYCNASFTQMSGYHLDDVLNSKVLWNVGDGQDEVRQSELMALQPGQQWQGEALTLHKDGSDCWQRQIVSPLYNGHGQMTHLVAVKQNVSQSRLRFQHVEQALLLREQALVSSSNGIMITRSDEHDHSIVYVNPAFARITGYSCEEVIGREGRFLVRDDLEQPGLDEIRNALREKREGHALLRNYRKDGSQFWNELHISPVKEASAGVTTHFVSVINDVSERVNYQKELEYQATHDSLTGLANRNLLNDRISQAIGWAKRQQLSVALFLLDLDHFKLINDGSGHSAGDDVLQEVAQRLELCVRETDTVARLGGDEFVIVLTDIQDSEDMNAIADKILYALSKPIMVGDHQLHVTASIGISLYPRDGDNGDTLLRYADIAMYRVKQHGRNSVRQFIPEMGVTAISRLTMEAALRRALERDEFVLHYQIKTELESNTIVGAEALIRWRNPQIGLIHPTEFIALAEETGLIIPIGEWVLEQACIQQMKWQQQGITPLKIAVNMSSRQFRQEDLAEKFSAIFQKTGASPENFILELTESMVMQDVESTLITLRDLKNLGLAISLDDFGTGYSSLSYLRKFPIDELKIDKSFINDIHINPDDAAIASAIIAMALSLGLKVVAEGVEKKEQVDILCAIQCQQVQGYYYGRPMDAASFAQRYEEHKNGISHAHSHEVRDLREAISNNVRV